LPSYKEADGVRDCAAARLALTAARRLAGGTLLPRILRGFRELAQIGLVEGELPHIHAAQAAGCAPVVRALEAGLEHPELVRPDTIAKSIAIGNPADGYQVLQSVRSTGGTGAAVTDTQIIDAIQLLAGDRRHLHGACRRHDAGGDESSWCVAA
jgi:threonine synthase